MQDSQTVQGSERCGVSCLNHHRHLLTLSPIDDGLVVTVTSTIICFHPNYDMVARRIWVENLSTDSTQYH